MWASNMKYSTSEIQILTQQVNILLFLENEYDLDFVELGTGWYQCQCPMPNHQDTNPSFGVNPESGKFNCFACGANGDIIELLCKLEGLSFLEACDRLVKYIGGINDDMSQVQRAAKGVSSYIDDFLQRFELSEYPGGMSKSQFLLTAAQRLKKFERKKGPSSITYIDNQYKLLDTLIENGDSNKIKLFWRNVIKNYEK